MNSSCGTSKFTTTKPSGLIIFVSVESLIYERGSPELLQKSNFLFAFLLFTLTVYIFSKICCQSSTVFFCVTWIWTRIATIIIFFIPFKIEIILLVLNFDFLKLTWHKILSSHYFAF